MPPCAPALGLPALGAAAGGFLIKNSHFPAWDGHYLLSNRDRLCGRAITFRVPVRWRWDWQFERSGAGCGPSVQCGPDARDRCAAIAVRRHPVLSAGACPIADTEASPESLSCFCLRRDVLTLADPGKLRLAPSAQQVALRVSNILLRCVATCIGVPFDFRNGGSLPFPPVQTPKGRRKP